MTLISSIILDAYRESNIVPINAVLNNNQNTEALRLYNAILSGLFGTDVGEILRDWPLGNFGRDPDFPCQEIGPNDYWIMQPPINTRLVAVNTSPISIDLTVRPQDGARYGIIDPYGQLATNPVTLNGNGRTIDGNPTFVANTNGLSNEWVYRADLGNWVSITNKALTDQNPFPAKFDEMFIILLAIRLNPRYGRDLTDLSKSILNANRTAFIAQYINSQPLVRDDSISYPFMSRMGWWWGRDFGSTTGFGRGNPYG